MNFTGDLSLYDAVVINRSLKGYPELQAKVKKILLMEPIESLEGKYDLYGISLSVVEWQVLIDSISKEEYTSLHRRLNIIRLYAGREPISSVPVSPSPQQLS